MLSIVAEVGVMCSLGLVSPMQRTNWFLFLDESSKVIVLI